MDQPPLGTSPLTPPVIPDYKLLRLIGKGGYGQVWLAQNVLGNLRAVKVIFRESFEHDRTFEREFDGIRRFEPISRSHDSQVDILHVGRNDERGFFYYVMELADDASAEGSGLDQSHQGGNPKPAIANADSYVPRSLKNELRRRNRLPIEECIELGLSLTSALGVLHENGLVHRDIKPSNIIFANGTPKLADIGLVTRVDASRSFVGTEGFAAPEGPGTPQADIYSLGKVLYEAATGQNVGEFPELPSELKNWKTGMV